MPEYLAESDSTSGKFSFMKRITFLLITLVITQYSYSQCVNSNEFPATATESDNSGEVQEITDSNETDEFATVTNIIPSDNYKFTITHAGMDDYVTITDGANNPIAYGNSPLTTSAIAVTTLRIHVSVDAGCGTDLFFHTTTIQNLTKATCNKPIDPGISYLSNSRIDFSGARQD